MSQTIGAGLRTVRDTLRSFLPAADADREARLMLGQVTGRTQASLLSGLSEALEPGQQRALADLLRAREMRQPLSQILGGTEFYGRRFIVTPDVLTPRPDTETLVDVALSETFDRVLDLGTGSGCILATLLSERPGTTGVGTDVSDAALAVAARNVAALGLTASADLRKSDWFENMEGPFDLIVSNPPYIACDEMAALAPEVRDWEPHLALSPGADGLAAYRRIVEAALDMLSRNGRLLVEIGHTQGPGVYRLFKDAGFDQVLLHSDINGHDRLVEGRPPNSAESL